MIVAQLMSPSVALPAELVCGLLLDLSLSSIIRPQSCMLEAIWQSEWSA